MSLADFFERVYWPNKTISEGTAKDYNSIFENHIGPALGSQRLLEIEPEEWSLFLHGLISKGMTTARVNRIAVTNTDELTGSFHFRVNAYSTPYAAAFTTASMASTRQPKKYTAAAVTGARP